MNYIHVAKRRVITCSSILVTTCIVACSGGTSTPSAESASSSANAATDQPTAPPMDTAAIEFAKPLFSGKMLACGTQTFAYVRGSDSGTRDTFLTELKSPQFVAEPDDVSKADTLNGLDYKGSVKLKWETFRVRKANKWSEWFDAKDAAMSAHLRPSEFVLVTHKNGQWSHNQIVGFDDMTSATSPKLDCSSIPQP
jgi:hypothetical protein